MLGRPLDALPEPHSGIVIRKADDPMGKKATANGIYRLNGHPFVMQAGQVLPDGAVVEIETEAEVEEPVEAVEVDETDEKRKKPAPQNRAKGKAPEDR